MALVRARAFHYHALAMHLKRALKSRAGELGFDLCGIAPATPAATAGAYDDWLDADRHGEMQYMARDPQRRAQPALVWPAARSVVVVAMNYRTAEGESLARLDPTRGQFARYALGDDYHEVIGARLARLLRHAQWLDPAIEGRWYVDTGPLLERDLAARAGLGWWGKNTNLLHRELGSYYFLGALLLNADLPPDAPTTAHCGACEACLVACPTDAFVGPYVLDARRCISYLTIELRGPIPRELRPLIGNWVFGCDICQEVCPWNRATTTLTQLDAFAPRADLPAPKLVELLRMDRATFNERFRGSPVKRAKWRGLLRNVCVALGNSGERMALPALEEALTHEEPLVRGHAAWAIGAIGDAGARSALRERLHSEEHTWAREELRLALGALAAAEPAGAAR